MVFFFRTFYGVLLQCSEKGQHGLLRLDPLARSTCTLDIAIPGTVEIASTGTVEIASEVTVEILDRVRVRFCHSGWVPEWLWLRLPQVAKGVWLWCMRRPICG